MLERIYIQNFQAHTKTKVEFSEGVTTIIGQSDIGKSAILRALRWLCLNSPQGSAFITDGEKGCAVKLVVDGQTITRKRTQNDNVYAINDQVYKAFGQGVPQAVQDLLAVTDLNFQQQHDAPFWLSLSPGEVSRQLNEIVDLGIIDKALTFATKRVRDTRKELQICEQRLKTARQDREDLEWVWEADEHWKRVQESYATMQRDSQAVAALRRLCSDIKASQCLRDNTQIAVEAGQDLLKKGQILLDRNEKIKKLSNLTQKIRKIQVAKIPSLVQLSRYAEDCQEIQRQRDRLRKSLKQIKNMRQQLDEKQKRLKGLNANVRMLTQDQTCPVCGGSMK